MKEILYKDMVPSEVVTAAEPSIAYQKRLIEVSRIGVKRADFIDFARLIGQSVQSLSTVIPASYSTLTKKDRFDQDTSARIYEIAQLYAQGREVFGSIDRFNHWMESPQVSLGGVTPFSLLDTGFGIEMVRQQVGRIDHGIFA